MNLLKKKNGFTLLELTIVTVIVGVLAAVTVPGFFNIRERSLSSGAITTIGLIDSAETNRRLQAGTPIDCNCLGKGETVNLCNDNATGCNVILNLRIDPIDWLYTVTNSPNYIITADRVGAGGDLDCVYTLSVDNITRVYNPANGKPAPNASCP